jgi:hypothetical protein
MGKNSEDLRIYSRAETMPNEESYFGIFHMSRGFIVSCDSSCGLHEDKEYVPLSKREECARRKLKCCFDYEDEYPFVEIEVSGQLWIRRLKK